MATFDPNTVGGATAGQLYPASNGFLYGSNDSGAAGETNGSIFVTDLSGNVRVLNSNTYGASPLTQASDGNLYGVSASSAGGSYNIFRMSKSGTMTILHSLGPNGQVLGPLMQGSDGYLYGTTGTVNGSAGSLFRMSLSGQFQLLHTFEPYIYGQGGLIEARNGIIYGIAISAQTSCPTTLGYIFAYTPSGKFQKIYSLYSCYPLGYGPSAGLVQESDGYLYGVTAQGGAYVSGSIFKIATDGSSYTTLVNLEYPFTGTIPWSEGASFVQGSDGAFYGTTDSGGLHQYGTIYRYGAGLLPPLPGIRSMQPSSGAPGTSVLIAGTHLIGLTGVSFNGVPATQILSRGVYYAVVTVPPGATSGPITVTTTNGSVTSAASFVVQ